MVKRGAHYVVVMITCDRGDEAREIARALVRTRAAACVSVYPKGESFYWWKGSMETAREHLLLAKTSLAGLPRLVEAVKKLHSYEVPEIVAIPLVGGSKEYLTWLTEELCGKKSRR
jgi:periplasmic divalent cation tolerance protein